MSGEFDFAVQVSTDQYKVLAVNDKAEPIIVPETMEHFFIFNESQPPFDNAKSGRLLIIVSISMPLPWPPAVTRNSGSSIHPI